jgi:dephospho-CoA kinase
LLESGWEHLVDQIIFVEAPAEVRWNRVKSRNWSETEWRQRETAQFSVEEKKRRADFVLDNSRDTDHLQMLIEALCLATLPPSENAPLDYAQSLP